MREELKLGNHNENKEKQEKVIGQLKQQTAEKLKGLSESWGLSHVTRVADFAKLIALGDGKDVFQAEAGALTHDWGRAEEDTDPKHRKHAELSFEAARAPYRKFYEQGLIDARQYGEIMRAVKRHSNKSGKTSREILKIVRDADSLSRFGAAGMYHTMILCEEIADMPFYLEGRPVIREVDAPTMKRAEIKCYVDDFNYVLGWRKLLETETGKKIATVLEPSWRAFLELISRHLDINDRNFWQNYLKSRADLVQAKALAYQQENKAETADQQLEMFRQAEDISIYSEEEFQKYLSEIK